MPAGLPRLSAIHVDATTILFTAVLAVVAGLAYAWLYIRTGKLWTAVIAHAVTNGVLGVWVVMTGNWQFW